MDWTHWINHELKTPLNRVESLLMTLEKSSKCGFDEKKLIMMMKRSLSDCRSTLDSLYLYNKIEMGEIKARFDQVDLNKLVSQSVQDSQHLANLKGLKLIVETEPLFPIYLDEQLFKRAFLNLLENAIKFSPNETKILISTEVVKENVYVQVSDQGEGISEDQISKVFKPYSRLDEASHAPGSGLGLYIAKKFLDLHHGKIEVDSEKGTGSTFSLVVPMNLKERS